MKKLPVLLLIWITVLCLNSAVFAQQPMSHDPAERANKLTEWMTTNLSLTADQVPRVQDINLRYAQKMTDLKQSTQPKPEKMNQLKSLSEQKDAEMKTVLNPDQYKSYEARKKEMEKRMKEKMHDRQ